MRILNVIVNLDERTGGGATERAYQLSRHWAKLGHEVTVLTTGFGITPERLESLPGVKVIALPCIQSRFFVPAPCFRQLSAAVKRADVVHIVSHWSILNAMAYAAVRFHGKPYVVNPLGALPIYGRSRIFKKTYNFLVGTNMIRNASRYVVATLNEGGAFRDYGADDSRMIHIPNGINEEDYQAKGDAAFRRQIGVGDHPYVLFMGRLNSIKGPDLLLQAFCAIQKKFPDYHLVFIGNDEGLKVPLAKMAEENSVAERVHFLGFVSRQDKSRIIHHSRLLVVPSRQEAMSIVVLEAGVAGKPVLITDQCGFDEVEKVGGGRVVPATAVGLAQGLSELLSQAHLLDGMGRKLEKFTKDNYIWSSIASRYEALFKELAVR